MVESIYYRKKKQTGIPFYGAVKSHNEVYFQMASLFKEITKGEADLSSEWMDRFLKGISNSPGKKIC